MATSPKYKKPALKREGKVQDLTFGQSTGSFSDASFPVNTPVSEFTFSG